jgi:ABC-type antimicrobial peptide transport system permease subunit
MEVKIRSTDRPAGEDQAVQLQIATEQYIKTMGIPVLRGRSFEPMDRDIAPVAIVSRELERRVFGGDALDKRIIEELPLGQKPFTYDVIGVVEDTKKNLSDDAVPTFYILDRRYNSVNHLIIRTATDPTALLPTFGQVIQNYDPHMVVTSTATMEQMLAQSIAEERFRALLAVVFSGFALLLSSIGLYGLVVKHIAERRREIGIRAALGARPMNILALICREGLMIVCFGLLIGNATAYGTSHLTRSLLFGVSPTSPHIFCMASIVLTAVAALATVAPALRATHIDPVAALKE